MAVLSLGLVFGLAVTTFPRQAHAGLISVILDWFKGGKQEAAVMIVNSQTMSLLKAVVNPDPISARGGGDITVLGDTALMPETGPNGSWTETGSANGRISTYVVREGDTVSQIAKMFGVSSNTIVWGNDLKGGLIKEGQVLVILPITGVQHTIAKGDTVSSIAKKYKGDVEDIMIYNGLKEGESLNTGSVIVVPGGVVVAPVSSIAVTVSSPRGAGGPDYGDYYLRPIAGGIKTQGLHGYNAIDFGAPAGTPILASASGQVILARHSGWNGGYGTYIVIDHPNGTQTLYSHLSGIAVMSGQEVVRGQVIGYIGSTGRSTGPHLHFEVRGAMNPF